jgi:hypothetical protein
VTSGAGPHAKGVLTVLDDAISGGPVYALCDMGPWRSRYEQHPMLVIALIILIVVVNFWWDSYHPIGFLFDVVIAFILVVKYEGLES